MTIRSLLARLAGATAFLAASFAHGQSANVSPTAPQSGAVVTVSIEASNLLAGQGEVRTAGTNIDATFYSLSCPTPPANPPATANASTLSLGALGAGTYRLQVFLRGYCPDTGQVTDLSQFLGSRDIVVTTNVAPDLTGLWWVPSESGWGISLVEGQFSPQLFAALYVYESDRHAAWFVMTGGQWISGDTFVGDLYRDTGSAYNQAWMPSDYTMTKVGTMTFQFTSANTANVTYTVDGTVIQKQMQRNSF